MKIAFLINQEHSKPTGLTNATFDRITSILPYLTHTTIITIREYDGAILKLLKKILNRPTNLQRSEGTRDLTTYHYRGIEVNVLWSKKTIVRLLLKRLGAGFLSQLLIAYRFGQKTKHFDLISAHWVYPFGYIASISSTLFGTPYTITCHGSDIHTIPVGNKNVFRWTRTALRGSSANIFVSQNLKETAERLCLSINNNIVIYNGIDPRSFSRSDVQKTQSLKKDLGISGKTVSYFGNLTYVKGSDRLPMIFSEISRKCRCSIDYLVIGDGDLLSAIQENPLLSELPVHFIPRQPHKDIQKLMSATDLLILPSRNEGLPLVLLEAMACQVDCIGSDVGGIREAIGEENVVSDNENFVSSFSNAASHKINNPSSAHQRLPKHFHISETARTEKELFSRIISTTPLQEP